MIRRSPLSEFPPRVPAGAEPLSSTRILADELQHLPAERILRVRGSHGLGDRPGLPESAQVQVKTGQPILELQAARLKLQGGMEFVLRARQVPLLLVQQPEVVMDTRPFRQSTRSQRAARI